MTSVKALSNEIFLNVSFKFVKMTKNKRVYADMVIQPYVTNYLTKKFSFKGSAKFKDVRTILIDHAESQWFIFYRNNELPEHHNWLVTDSKGMGFDFETVADLLPAQNPHLRNKSTFSRSAVVWLVLNDGNFLLLIDISNEEPITKRSRLDRSTAYKITKTIAVVVGETKSIVECFNADGQAVLDEFCWKEGITLKLPVKCVVGKGITGPEGTFRDCFAFSIITLPTHELVCKRFKEGDSLQRHLNDLKTLKRAKELVASFQDTLKTNELACQDLLKNGLKRMTNISFVDAFVVDGTISC